MNDEEMLEQFKADMNARLLQLCGRPATDATKNLVRETVQSLLKDFYLRGGSLKSDLGERVSFDDLVVMIGEPNEGVLPVSFAIRKKDTQ